MGGGQQQPLKPPRFCLPVLEGYKTASAPPKASRRERSPGLRPPAGPAGSACPAPLVPPAGNFCPASSWAPALTSPRGCSSVLWPQHRLGCPVLVLRGWPRHKPWHESSEAGPGTNHVLALLLKVLIWIPSHLSSNRRRTRVHLQGAAMACGSPLSPARGCWRMETPEGTRAGSEINPCLALQLPPERSDGLLGAHDPAHEEE